MNATGPRTTAPGILYGRSASGTVLRSALIDSGAPAYMSTLAPVTRETSECQLGNGSRNTSPNRKAKIRLTHGTPAALVRAKICG